MGFSEFLFVVIPFGVLADFLAHRKKKGWWILFHCFIYTLLLTPIFFWLKIDFLWLILVYFSHLGIDSCWNFFLSFMENQLKEGEGNHVLFKFYTALLDQILHLFVFIIIAFFTFIGGAN